VAFPHDARAEAETLSRASRFGLIDDVERLLAAGADPNQRDAQGLKPLSEARVEGFEDVATLLIQAGAIDAPWEPAKAIDAELHAKLGPRSPGMVVRVSRHGEIIYETAVGLANMASGTPATAATQFRIGSVTKQFTAVGILLLDQDGKLRVSDRLSKYFPDYPRGDDITLHHLLNHTSGIPSYTEKAGFFETVTVFTTTEELIESFKADPLNFEPGAKWEYCNSGYALLGNIIELVSGQSYGDFLHKRLFEPLGMLDTGVHPKGIDRAREALGYELSSSGAKPALDWDMSRAAGAGALYSTVVDIARWNEVLFADREISEKAGAKPLPPSPLTPATLERALVQARVVITPGSPVALYGNSHYGYGWGIGHNRGLSTISHSGGLHGAMSLLAYYPHAGLSIAILHNAGPSTIAPMTLGNRIAQLYLWPEMEKRRPQRLDPAPDRSQWADIAGRYQFRSGIMAVSLRNGQLYAQLSRQQELPIFPARREPLDPASESRFFYRVVDAQLTFVRGASGAVTRVRHHQNGTDAEHQKLPLLPTIEVAADKLDEYAGGYDFGSGILTVERDGHGLFATMSGQSGAPIFPRSETDFFWKVIDAHIEFVRDNEGQVTHANYEQNGAKRVVQRVR
jgi:CubicO group peptidase (beta-lactamase class C family)